MEVHPPYLLGNGDHENGSGVSVTYDIDTAVIEMVVAGRWTKRLALDIYTALCKCLAEHPSAIIVNLHHLDDPSADSAAMWLAASTAAGGLQPPVQIALSVPASQPLSHRLRWAGVTPTVPMFTTTKQARTAAAHSGPLTERVQLTRLRPDAGSANAARGLIDVACEAWGFADLRHPSRLVISELVANAVEHAGTDMVVTVWRRRNGLHLTVHDGDARLPRMWPPTRTDEARAPSGAHGLHIVDTLSAAWGALSTTEGKLVWATMRSCRRPWP
jgi:hypothetical protein